MCQLHSDFMKPHGLLHQLSTRVNRTLCCNPFFLDVAPFFFLFFLSIDFFSYKQHFATFYVSLYDIYNKYNQTVVSIHAGFLTMTCQKPGMDRKLQMLFIWKKIDVKKKGGEHRVLSTRTVVKSTYRLQSQCQCVVFCMMYITMQWKLIKCRDKFWND